MDPRGERLATELGEDLPGRDELALGEGFREPDDGLARDGDAAAVATGSVADRLIDTLALALLAAIGASQGSARW